MQGQVQARTIPWVGQQWLGVQEMGQKDTLLCGEPRTTSMKIADRLITDMFRLKIRRN